MPAKKHSKLVLIITVTASFLLCTSTLWYESEANLVIFLHYESAGKLAELILILKRLPLKGILAALGMLQKVLSCISTSPNTWVWLGWLQHLPALVETPSNRHWAEMLDSYQELCINSTTESISNQTACRWNTGGLQAQK